MLAKRDIKKESLCHNEKFTVTLHLSRMPWDSERWVYIASHVNVARFVFNKAVYLFKLESNNTTDIYG
jgi:hypothetical protein